MKKIISILFVFILMISISGCLENKSEQEKVLDKFINSMQNGDVKTCETLIDDFSKLKPTSNINDWLFLMSSKLSYKKVSSDIQKDVANITFEMRNIDLDYLMEETLTSVSNKLIQNKEKKTDEEIKTLALEEAKNKLESVKEYIGNSFDLKFEKKDNNWIIKTNKYFENILKSNSTIN